MGQQGSCITAQVKTGGRGWLASSKLAAKRRHATATAHRSVWCVNRSVSGLLKRGLVTVAGAVLDLHQLPSFIAQHRI